jgi:CRISPR-associated protein Csm4
MTLYKTRIVPEARFVTPLRGDTLFGQLCWGIVHRFGEERLKKLLESYDDKPFVVVSDGFAPGHLPKPTLPSSLLGESPEEKKANRKKRWLTPETLTAGKYTEARTDKEAGYTDNEVLALHNSLNYKTFRTEKETFAPYGAMEREVSERDVYLLIDEAQTSTDEIGEALRIVSLTGFGKESGIGKGRFSFTPLEKVQLPFEGRTFMALSPLSLEDTPAMETWYEPFTRFGKHGDARARKATFKRPLLLSDTGAVLQFDTAGTRLYVGRALRGVSPAHPDTVHQGYAIAIAIPEVQR